MKKMICLQLGVLLLLAGACTNCSSNKLQESSQKDKIVFYSSPELYDLTSEWAGVFCTLNPEVEIEVVKATESIITENLEKNAQLSFVTSNFEPEIYDRSLWKVIVGRDIIVPVINSRNPFVQEICNQGISTAGLARILNNPENTRWSTLIENGPDLAVNLYMTNDVNLHAGIARFLETDRVSFNEQNTRESKALVASVQSDEYALGICYLMDMIDPGNKNLYEDIRILPIDRNGNGYIDYKEDVYSSMDAFARGVWIGKYPKNLSNNIYTVSTSPPSKDSELAFLSWVITSGQVLLDNHRFCDLPDFERLAQAKIIDSYIDQPGPGGYTLPNEPGFLTGPIPYILAFLILFTMLLYFRLRIWNRRSVRIHVQEPILSEVQFNEDNIEISPGHYYDKTHTWAFLEKDGMVKVGIDDFIQHVTGPLTRIKMKLPGRPVKKGMQVVSIIQDGKQLDICSPISGTIREQNTDLATDASLLNSSPIGEGWIYKIEPANWSKEVQFLLMGNKYKLWLKKEFQRLKEFILDSLRFEEAGYAHILQDGGELKDNILKDLGPEMWEEFQTNYIDVF